MIVTTKTNRPINLLIVSLRTEHARAASQQPIIMLLHLKQRALDEQRDPTPHPLLDDHSGVTSL